MWNNVTSNELQNPNLVFTSTAVCGRVSLGIIVVITDFHSYLFEPSLLLAERTCWLSKRVTECYILLGIDSLEPQALESSITPETTAQSLLF